MTPRPANVHVRAHKRGLTADIPLAISRENAKARRAFSHLVYGEKHRCTRALNISIYKLLASQDSRKAQNARETRGTTSISYHLALSIIFSDLRMEGELIGFAMLLKQISSTVLRLKELNLYESRVSSGRITILTFNRPVYLSLVSCSDAYLKSTSGRATSLPRVSSLRVQVASKPGKRSGRQLVKRKRHPTVSSNVTAAIGGSQRHSIRSPLPIVDDTNRARFFSIMVTRVSVSTRMVLVRAPRVNACSRLGTSHARGNAYYTHTTLPAHPQHPTAHSPK